MYGRSFLKNKLLHFVNYLLILKSTSFAVMAMAIIKRLLFCCEFISLVSSRIRDGAMFIVVYVKPCMRRVASSSFIISISRHVDLSKKTFLVVQIQHYCIPYLRKLEHWHACSQNDAMFLGFKSISAVGGGEGASEREGLRWRSVWGHQALPAGQTPAPAVQDWLHRAPHRARGARAAGQPSRAARQDPRDSPRRGVLTCCRSFFYLFKLLTCLSENS